MHLLKQGFEVLTLTVSIILSVYVIVAYYFLETLQKYAQIYTK